MTATANLTELLATLKASPTDAGLRMVVADALTEEGREVEALTCRNPGRIVVEGGRVKATVVVDLIAEVYGREGPTGLCREVLEVAVCDYGGNELGRAKTALGLRRLWTKIRGSTRLKVIAAGNFVTCDAHHPDHTIDCGGCE